MQENSSPAQVKEIFASFRSQHQGSTSPGLKVLKVMESMNSDRADWSLRTMAKFGGGAYQTEVQREYTTRNG